MAMLGPDPRPYSQVASGCIQSHIGNSGSQNNIPLNRGLERAFEEAANSGFLNVSARKLKEFPSSASNHDLTDTVEADLSKNRLTDIPLEVSYFVSLETLNLYHNCIRTIPESIISLQTLTSLNLSRNQLSALPACLCALPLRVLIASNNKLGSLPEAIGQLRSLMELDVSCNEITTLPQHIGRLKALRQLNVRRNLLSVLPEDLAELPLVKFDFSCNKVSTIPVRFRKMTQLQSLQLENNPLQSPPARICIKGREHIFKYLSVEACRSDLGGIDRLSPSQPAAGSIEDIDQNKKQDTDSGVGSDNGDKRLSATEPSDEDSLSLNVPMSHITEEEGLSKDDSSDHISSLTADPSQDASGITGRPKDRFGYRDSALSEPFVSYIQERATDFEEPLRIEEESSWDPEQTSKGTGGREISFDMINQLREAVQLLQDPSRVNFDHMSGVHLYPVEMVIVEDSQNGQECEDEQTTAATPKSETSDGGHEFQKKRELILERTRLEAQLACQQFENRVSQGDPTAGRGQNHNPAEPVDSGYEGEEGSSAPFGLKPRSVFLRTPKSLESLDPQFTIRRKMEQLREELELTEQLRESIESRLKMSLPDDLGSSLMDGVVLCHLVNHIQPRAVASIHVPSPAVPKLSMAKCRRNVESFLDACRKMGVPEEKLCLPHHILEKTLVKVSVTVHALVDKTSIRTTLFT